MGEKWELKWNLCVYLPADDHKFERAFVNDTHRHTLASHWIQLAFNIHRNRLSVCRFSCLFSSCFLSDHGCQWIAICDELFFFAQGGPAPFVMKIFIRSLHFKCIFHFENATVAFPFHWMILHSMTNSIADGLTFNSQVDCIVYVSTSSYMFNDGCSRDDIRCLFFIISFSYFFFFAWIYPRPHSIQSPGRIQRHVPHSHAIFSFIYRFRQKRACLSSLGQISMCKLQFVKLRHHK